MARMDGIETESEGLSNLCPINDVVFSSVPVPNITGLEPAFSVYYSPSSFRVPEIALHDERSSDVDFGLFLISIDDAAILRDESGKWINNLWAETSN